MSESTQVSTAPPSRAEMIQIAIGLMVVCLIASVILGTVFYITEPAKEHNIRAREQVMIGRLLNLEEGARVDQIRRYLFWRGKDLEILYLTPKQLVRFDAEGKELDAKPIPEDIRSGGSEQRKDEWAKKTVTKPEDENFRYVGRFFVGFKADRTAGYVVEGVTAGFKTWIRFFLAISSDYSLRGIEVIEHEEDPGLGAEITEEYFKNQFAGRDYQSVISLKVIKDPQPNEWKKALEKLGTEQTLDEWLPKFGKELEKHPNIYAITGSTISSVAVADGVKRALKNFRKRMNLVENYL